MKDSIIHFWLHPGRIIKKEVERNSLKFPMILVIIAGMYDWINTSISNNSGNDSSLTTILILTLTVGSLLGYISFLIGSWVTDLVAGWFKGERDLRGFRIAYAWSQLPIVANLIVIIPFIFSARESFFLTSYNNGLYLFLDGIMAIPYIVYSIIAIKVFYNFSIGKSIIVYLVPAILLICLMFVIVLPFALL